MSSDDEDALDSGRVVELKGWLSDLATLPKRADGLASSRESQVRFGTEAARCAEHQPARTMSLGKNNRKIKGQHMNRARASAPLARNSVRRAPQLGNSAPLIRPAEQALQITAYRL